MMVTVLISNLVWAILLTHKKGFVYAFLQIKTSLCFLKDRFPLVLFNLINLIVAYP